MRTTMSLLVVVLILAGHAGAEEATRFEGPQEEIDAIFQLFGKWGAARDAGDVQGVVDLYHPDMEIMTRSREILVGQDGARTFYDENYGQDSNRQLFSTMSELRVFGDIAFVAGKFLALDEDDGVVDPGYYMIVLRKDESGNWRIYRDIDTPSPDGLTLKPEPESPASGQMKPAPWPARAPEFESAVFARAGVTVRDIDESLKFYRDVLGMTVIHERKAMYDPRLDRFSGLTSDQTIRLVILRPAISGDAKFHAGYIALSELSDADGERIDPKDNVSTSGSEPGSIMLQFMVEDAKEVHRQVLKLGYEVISSPDPDQPYGELLVRDPNGVRFWITDRYPRTILLR